MYSQTINHPSVNIFQEYLDHELAIPDRKVLEEHLKNCPRCKATLTSFNNLYSQIEKMPEISLSRDLSSEIIGTIESQSNINLSFPRKVVFTQVLITVIMIVAIFSVLIVDYDFSFLSRIQFDWIANVQAFINSISRGLNNFYHSLFEVDFSISNPSFFSFSIILTTGYLLLLTISTGLLWVVGNRVLLSNLNQNKFNGG